MTRAMTLLTALAMPRVALLGATLTLAGVTTFAQTPDTTFLEELTWTLRPVTCATPAPSRCPTSTS